MRLSKKTWTLCVLWSVPVVCFCGAIFLFLWFPREASLIALLALMGGLLAVLIVRRFLRFEVFIEDHHLIYNGQSIPYHQIESVEYEWIPAMTWKDYLFGLYS